MSPTTVATPLGNSAVIQSELSQAVVGPLQQASTFLSLPGITIIDTAEPLRIPVAAATSPTAAFTAPGTQITSAAVAFNEVDLLPSSLNSIKSLIPISNELIRQSRLALDSILTTRIVEDLAVVLDNALYNGAGGSGTVTGIFNQAGITHTVNANLLTSPDVLIEALAAMGEEYVSPSVLVMRPSTFAALRIIKVSSTDNRYVFDISAAFAPAQSQLLGLPVVLTTHINANEVAILDTSKIFVGRDTNSVVQVLTETYGDYDTVALRCVSRYDVALTHPAGVQIITTA